MKEKGLKENKYWNKEPDIDKSSIVFRSGEKAHMVDWDDPAGYKEEMNKSYMAYSLPTSIIRVTK
jgi:hypothetical protein